MVVGSGGEGNVFGGAEVEGEVGAHAVVVVDGAVGFFVVFEHVGDAEPGRLFAFAGESEAAAAAEQTAQADAEIFVVLELAEKFVGKPGGEADVVAQVLKALVDEIGGAGFDELDVGDGEHAPVVVLVFQLKAGADADDGLGVLDPVEAQVAAFVPGGAVFERAAFVFDVDDLGREKAGEGEQEGCAEQKSSHRRFFEVWVAQKYGEFGISGGVVGIKIALHFVMKIFLWILAVRISSSNPSSCCFPSVMTRSGAGIFPG